MSEFKEGDKVVCIDAKGSFNLLREGQEYTVNLACNEVISLEGSNGVWLSERFALVQTHAGISLESLASEIQNLKTQLSEFEIMKSEIENLKFEFETLKTVVLKLMN